MDTFFGKKRTINIIFYFFVYFLILVLCFAGCTKNSNKPFEYLTAETVESIRVEYPTEADYVFVDLDEKDIVRVVDALNKLTLYNSHDTVYYGESWRITVNYYDGKQSVLSGSSKESITIDEVYYRWEIDDTLNNLCSELHPNKS